VEHIRFEDYNFYDKKFKKDLFSKVKKAYENSIPQIDELSDDELEFIHAATGSGIGQPCKYTDRQCIQCEWYEPSRGCKLGFIK